MTKIIVKTVLGTVVYVGKTNKNVDLFSVRNEINTRMNLKFGSPISIEYIKAGGI